MARVLQENFSCDAGGGRAFDFKPSLSRRQKYQRAGNPVVLPAQAWEVQTRLAIIAVGFLEDRLPVVATDDADLTGIRVELVHIVPEKLPQPRGLFMLGEG